MTKINHLTQGDTIGIICTARSVSYQDIQFAVDLFSSWGLNVKLGNTINKKLNIFGGSDQDRIDDFENMCKDPDIKAIICAKGGYGTVRIIDKIDFSILQKNPKWIVGFSDVTVLHSHINCWIQMPSIHASMPFNLENKTEESILSLKKALFGEEIIYQYKNESEFSRKGDVEADVIGGNLAIIYSLQNSYSEIDTNDKILFIEDVGEWLYNIDRMMFNLLRSGKLNNLKGLIIGGFTNLQDNEDPFGMSYKEIIWEKVKKFNYPVCFDFPAGHIDNNCAIKLGQKAILRVGETITFIQK